MGAARLSSEARPAFYALAPGGWRDYVTLLHPPYTLWHLSYVAIGAALAPEVHPWRLVLALAAFFLAMGIGAHALDELRGRPLQTRIPDRTLIALGVVSVASAAAIGIACAFAYDLWLLAFVAVGAFLVPAYNLELFGGRFHNDVWFALAWGAFPLLTGYVNSAGRLTAEALLAAAAAALLSAAQRTLSKPVRHVRRRVRRVTGAAELVDGSVEPLDERALMAAPEIALRLLAGAVFTLAAALLVFRLR